ncbi:MAG TPA: S53 family peptidase [Acidimicrobiales bacterium]|nr:S53 family peptidase [Acidimicrobiales bacterium]
MAAVALAAAVSNCGHASAAGGASSGSGTPARLPGLSADCLIHAPGCYTPQVIRDAYGIAALLDRGTSGRGVTVVLPEIAQTGSTRPPAVTDIRQDMADFDSRFGLPKAQIQVITDLAGPSASPWSARLEEVQDTELVHAVAPGANIDELLVDPTVLANPAEAAGEFSTLVRLAASNESVISFSVSFGEHLFSSAQVAAVHSALEYAASKHVTVIAASGDDGVLGKGSITPPVKEVSLPASDPLVLSVGGTGLKADSATGAYISEAAWNSPAGATGGEPAASGGGFSHLFAKPSYQDGVPGITATRGVPDVAADASPYSGMAVARTGPDRTYMLTGAGGTSASAPLWAGLIALADQQAGHPLGLVNPAIYRIATGSQYHRAFHDITTGNNTMTVTTASGPATIAGYPARPGWDPVTGWGTPNAQVLVPLLATEAP